MHIILRLFIERVTVMGRFVGFAAALATRTRSTANVTAALSVYASLQLVLIKICFCPFQPRMLSFGACYHLVMAVSCCTNTRPDTTRESVSILTVGNWCVLDASSVCCIPIWCNFPN